MSKPRVTWMLISLRGMGGVKAWSEGRKHPLDPHIHVLHEERLATSHVSPPLCILLTYHRFAKSHTETNDLIHLREFVPYNHLQTKVASTGTAFHLNSFSQQSTATAECL